MTVLGLLFMISVGFNAAARSVIHDSIFSSSHKFYVEYSLLASVKDFLGEYTCHFVLSSVRVSNELGAGNPRAAAFSVIVVTTISFIISIIFAIAILLLRNIISYAFTEGEEVSDAVAELCPFLAVSFILNGIQPVLSG